MTGRVGTLVEWMRPVAIGLVAVGALLTGLSASLAGAENAALDGWTTASLETDELRGTLTVRPGDHEFRIPALLRVGFSYDDSRLEDLRATLNVYVIDFEDGTSTGRTHLFAAPDAFEAHRFRASIPLPPAAERARFGDNSLLELVWTVSGASQSTRASLLEDLANRNPTDHVVAMPEAATLRHGAFQAVAGACLPTAAVLGLWRRPTASDFSDSAGPSGASGAASGHLGMGLALAEQGERWLRGLRDAYLVVASLLALSLTLYAWLVAQATIAVQADSWLDLSAQPYGTWQTAQFWLVAGVCVTALALAGRSVGAASNALAHWRRQAAAAPLEGLLDD